MAPAKPSDGRFVVRDVGQIPPSSYICGFNKTNEGYTPVESQFVHQSTSRSDEVQETALPKVLWHGRTPLILEDFEENFLARDLAEDAGSKATKQVPVIVGFDSGFQWFLMVLMVVLNYFKPD